MNTTTAREKIGFIGLGLMGYGIAKNIVDKGYPLTFLGRKNRKPAEDLASRGAKEASTSRDVAAASDIVFICVTGSREVEAIIRGPGGLKEGLKKGSVVVDCSTSDPVSTVALAAELKALSSNKPVSESDLTIGGSFTATLPMLENSVYLLTLTPEGN